MSKSNSDIAEQLKNLVKVFAYAQIKDEKGTDRKARFLKTFGLTEQEIADLLGVTQPAVNIALSKSKKKKKTPESE
jgi:orotate phosphoribosyltransferase-like protein